MSSTAINGYEYTTDDKTGTITANGDVQNEKAARNSYAQVHAGGEAREAEDDGGHIIAASMNGHSGKENLAPMHRDVNRGAYKALENAERNLASQDNVTVHTEKTAFVSNQRVGDDTKPDAFMVNDTITYANGDKDIVHLSFANMSKDEQAQNNAYLENNVDISDVPGSDASQQASSLDGNAYADLMGKTDAELSTVRGEYVKADYFSFENSPQEEPATANNSDSEQPVADDSPAADDTYTMSGEPEAEQDTSPDDSYDFSAGDDTEVSETVFMDISDNEDYSVDNSYDFSMESEIGTAGADSSSDTGSEASVSVDAGTETAEGISRGAGLGFGAGGDGGE